LLVTGGSVHLNLTAIASTVFQNIEVIDITGSAANTLTLALSDVLDISSTTNLLRIDGNPGDGATIGDGWLEGAAQDIGGQFYRTYNQNIATLLIDTDIAMLG
jgi:hypothetical protein